MNRSQAVTAGVWYNPTAEQRRELAERAAAMRSPQLRQALKVRRFVSEYISGVQQSAREAYERDTHAAARGCASDAAYRGALASAYTVDELRAIRNMLDEVAQ